MLQPFSLSSKDYDWFRLPKKHRNKRLLYLWYALKSDIHFTLKKYIFFTFMPAKKKGLDLLPQLSRAGLFETLTVQWIWKKNQKLDFFLRVVFEIKDTCI